MNGKQLAHMENGVTEFVRDYRAKQARGQSEHGGNLWEKPSMLRHAKDEVLDQWAYLTTLDKQLRELALGLRSGAITPQAAADQIDRMRT